MAPLRAPPFLGFSARGATLVLQLLLPALLPALGRAALVVRHSQAPPAPAPAAAAPAPAPGFGAPAPAPGIAPGPAPAPALASASAPAPAPAMFAVAPAGLAPSDYSGGPVAILAPTGTTAAPDLPSTPDAWAKSAASNPTWTLGAALGAAARLFGGSSGMHPAAPVSDIVPDVSPGRDFLPAERVRQIASVDCLEAHAANPGHKCESEDYVPGAMAAPPLT
eukprot:TRINITY_DN71752_c0_g1_i1.p1 TRINITY_DN71752_c0_g1~~TRINITY_DN71752_c0_g1_i1.p1  ORF type:complete len:222 (-),score=41.69 TRINITY_DN71752_c0_g1_i1:108-773(-)